MTRLAVCCLSVHVYLFVVTQAASAQWNVEVVDSAGNTGQFAQLVLDTLDNPHFVYHDVTNLDTRYATKAGGIWTYSIVDSTTNNESFVRLAVDSQNRPHVSYQKPVNGSITSMTYATKVGSQWTQTNVLQGIESGAGSSIAVDSLDRPHIAYMTNGNNLLQYSKFNGSIWQTETVHNSLGTSDLELVLDSTDAPHIVRRSVEIRHHQRTAGIWGYSVLDTTSTPGLTLAISDDDMLFLTYGKNGTMLATYNGTSWTSEIVDGDGSRSAIATDGNGLPHLVYNRNGLVRYAHYTGTEWLYETVSTDFSMAHHLSIDVDSAGRAHIGFQNFINKDLVYLYRTNAIPEPAQLAGVFLFSIGMLVVRRSRFDNLKRIA